MKRLLFVCALFAVITLLPAAEAEAQGFGLKAGFVWAELSGEADGEYKRQRSLSGGLFFKLRAGPLQLQPEVLYVRRGARVDPSITPTTFELDYLEVPVLLRLGGGTSALYVGGYGALKLSGKLVQGEGDARTELDIADTLEDYDYGLVFGLDMGFGQIALDGRYTIGLRPMFKTGDGPPAIELKHRALSVYTTVTF